MPRRGRGRQKLSIAAVQAGMAQPSLSSPKPQPKAQDSSNSALAAVAGVSNPIKVPPFCFLMRTGSQPSRCLPHYGRCRMSGPACHGEAPSKPGHDDLDDVICQELLLNSRLEPPDGLSNLPVFHTLCACKGESLHGKRGYSWVKATGRH